jgi:hypothetical protein
MTKAGCMVIGLWRSGALYHGGKGP